MRISRSKTVLLLGLVFLFPARPFQAQTSMSMEDRISRIVSAFPFQNTAGRDSLTLGILNLGSRAVDHVFRNISPSDRPEGAATQYAAHALVLFAGRPEAEKDRLLVVRSLSKALSSEKHPDIKAFLIEQIRIVGRDESIKTLRKLVAHPDLGDPAIRALTSISSPSAEQALLKSLSKTRGRNRLAVVGALGDMKSLAAVPKLTALVSSEDPDLRTAALEALSRIGDPRSEPLFTLPFGQLPEDKKESSLALKYASNLARRGQEEKAARICIAMLDRTRMTGSESCAALETLVSILEDSAMGDLLRASESPDLQVRSQALALASRIPGNAATVRWIEKLKEASSSSRAEIVAMLGFRGDSTALPAMMECLADPDSSVLEAAVFAAARLGGDREFDNFLGALKEGGPKQAALFEQVFSSHFNTPSVSKMFENFGALSPDMKSAAFRIASARRAWHVFDKVLASTSDPDSGIARAAARCLPALAGEENISLLIRRLDSEYDPVILSSLHAALANAVSRIPDPGLRIKRLLDDPQAGSGDALLPVLPLIGGAEGLEYLAGLAQNRNSDFRRAAITTLSGWMDTDASFLLFDLFKNSPFKDSRRQALAGWIGLAKRCGFSPLQRLEGIRDGLACAKNTEEKKILLDGLSNLRIGEALFLAASFLKDASLREYAIRTMADIACPSMDSDPGLTGPEVLDLLKKASAMVRDNSIRARIQAHVSSPESKAAVFNRPPEGFTALFNGRNLDGWKGLVDDPIGRAKMNPETLRTRQAAADSSMKAHWSAKDGILFFDGKGSSLCTAADVEDFELLVDWKIGPGGDSGIYLRGAPQVQIWDPAGHPEGSGGLYNNQVHPRNPLVCVDRPAGEWNTFRILMEEDRVTVYLNGILVADRVVMENYWDRSIPIFRKGQIELQNHGNPLYFRNVFIRPVAARPAWKELFNGRDLEGWVGDVRGYKVENGTIVSPETGGGNLYTIGEYGDFAFRFEFRLLPGSNNGLGIRVPLSGDAAYVGLEIQIIDDSAPVYTDLKPYQYHGSIYGVVPSHRGFQKPVGEWNEETVVADGRRVTVYLNGIPIVDADLDSVSTPKTMDGHDHPGLKRETGHIGFLGHGSRVEFRNIRVQDFRPARIRAAAMADPSKKGVEKGTSGKSKRSSQQYK